MRRDVEFLEDCEPALVYIAKKLKEALAVEEMLTAHGIDYVVQPERYIGGVIFRSERVGAFFYVRPDAEEGVRLALEAKGYRPIPREGF